ncbi:MAG: hypothetical protein PF572_02585 [Patescibacteria group bacterium]|jgi:hypothetical protein|nr:hypothetical protein [Patescibacteria group bacterium]
MNIFIYDSFLSEKKYSNTLSKIETRITDLGLNGKIIRLSLLKNVVGSIDNEIKMGAKTLIAVGNNHTLNKILNSVCTSDHPDALKIPIFIIPVGKENNEISLNLGVSNFLNACEILSSRRIEELNMVKANNLYFLSQASINTMGTKVEIDENYTIEIIDQGSVIINNLNLSNKELPDNTVCLPNDNKIELFIKSKKEKKVKSVFIFDQIIIENKNKNLVLDKSFEVQTPVLIKISEKKVKLIVGKGRMF